MRHRDGVGRPQVRAIRERKAAIGSDRRRRPAVEAERQTIADEAGHRPAHRRCLGGQGDAVDADTGDRRGECADALVHPTQLPRRLAAHGHGVQAALRQDVGESKRPVAVQTQVGIGAAGACVQLQADTAVQAGDAAADAVAGHRGGGAGERQIGHRADLTAGLLNDRKDTGGGRHGDRDGLGKGEAAIGQHGQGAAAVEADRQAGADQPGHTGGDGGGVRQQGVAHDVNFTEDGGWVDHAHSGGHGAALAGGLSADGHGQQPGGHGIGEDIGAVGAQSEGLAGVQF